jgi:hypothetical protein
MRHLSISQAWDETRAILKRDGRLLTIVALAMVALPMAVLGVVSPRGLGEDSRSVGLSLVTLICSRVALGGQLALIRMALSSGETVGSAIVHGLRRMPIFMLAFILVGIGLFIAAIPFGAVLAMAGVPINQTAGAAYNPLTVVAVLLYMALIVFGGVRLIMTAPVASAEPVGIIGILRRSWHLTSGNWLRLFGFMLMFVGGMIVSLFAVEVLTSLVTSLLLGRAEPLSASALIIALVQGLVNAAVTIVFSLMLARIYAQLAGASEAQVSVPSSGI